MPVTDSIATFHCVVTRRWIACAWPWHPPAIIEIGQARLGWRSPPRLSGGVELGLLQAQLATKPSTAATQVRLRDGHQGTKTIATIAVELGSSEFAMLRAA